MAVLVVLLIGAGIFAGVSASNASTKSSELKSETANANAFQAGLNKAKSDLATSQAANASQSSEIAAYKACLNDLKTLGTDAINSVNGSVPSAVLGQTQVDCGPLGLNN
jgi:hypothetical protein